MAVASPALALESTTVQSFTFPRRKHIKLQVRFYSDANATVGNELDVLAGGSRVLTVTTTSAVVTLDRTYYQLGAVSAINNGSQACAGATWYEFDLTDGLGQLHVSATAGTDPGGALSYRIWADIEPNG